ncbi:MAG: efflux RND transporter periplasmic adaptor subunit [Calditrichaeota bacterium]|nr:MAG: efflux RND transporter periplasmic adaptor subunit [Calditrichota bacterium]
MRRCLFGLLALVLFGQLGCGGSQQNWRFTGVVEGTDVQVPALTGGKLVALPVQEGQPVARGQLLAQVDSTELHLEWLRSQAALREVSGQINVARIQLAQARADLELAQTTFERLDKLYQQGSLPQQQWDEARNRYQKARVAYRMAGEQLATLQARQKQIRASLALLRKKLADTRIYAPVSGILTTRYFEVGEAVPPLGSVVEVLRLDTVWVKVYLSEHMLSRVQPGDSARIHVNGRAETLPGEIVWISPEAEFTPKNILTPETRTALVYAVKVNIANPRGWLKRGMPVEVELFPGEDKGQ